MSFDPMTLPWLPAPPEGFRDACRALSGEDKECGLKIHALASHALSDSQASSLAKTMARVRLEGAELAPLAPFKLAILPSSTFDILISGLPAAAARHGVNLDVALYPPEQVEMLAFDPTSALWRKSADAVLIAIDHYWLGMDRPLLTMSAGVRSAEALARVRRLADRITEAGATPIVPTVPCPPATLFGSYERRAVGSVRAMIEEFNVALPNVCAETGSTLFDVAAIAQTVGAASWFNRPLYNLYKLPFSPDAAPLYTDNLARVLGALRGKARKCLVLDLDNTLWGGVIGDDGLEGIRISPGSAEGESFRSVQATALDLKARGVILAVCSKNDEANARAPFREHPDMLLRESDIAVFQANWSDKASNLEAIASALNIGVDSLVLLDDNGAERAQVRSVLPMVAVPELPADPALYADTLLAAGYFEALSFSREDVTRAESYASNAQRAELLAKSRDPGDYLSSLEMRIHHSPFDAVGRARIAQLINKSNQFNLTTRRYTEQQVAEMERGGVALTLQTRLSDKYCDFGMIAVMVARRGPPEEARTWEIDTWLMSCRVLGRKVEDSMLAHVVAAARTANIERLIGHYRPTVKNRIVREHYDGLGFTPIAEHSDGGCDYALDLGSYAPPSLPFAE